MSSAPSMSGLEPEPIRRRGSGVRLAMVAATFALAVAACSSSGGSADDSTAPATASEGAGEAAAQLPAVEIALAGGAGTTTLADRLDGRPLVVNFFASWCPPCRAEMPDLQALHVQTEGEVDFFGVALQDAEEDSADLIEEVGTTYPWGLDPDGQLYAAVGAFAMPTTLFISADGEVLRQANGALSADQLRDAVADNFGVAS